MQLTHIYKKKLTYFFVLFAAYAFLALLFTYPAYLTFNTKLIGDGGDTIEYFSYQKLALQNMQLKRHPFEETHTFRFPFGFAFSGGSDAKFFVLTGAIIQQFLGDIVTYNMLFFVILIANSFATYLFFRSFGFSKLSSAIGGFLYGNSYYVLSKGAGHINLMQIYGFPLFGYSIVSLTHKPSRLHSIILFASLIFIAGSSIQYILVLSCGLTIILPIGYILLKSDTLSLLKNVLTNSITLIVLSILSLIIFLYFFGSFLQISLSDTFPTVLTSNPQSFYSYIFPNAWYKSLIQIGFAKIFAPSTNNTIDASLYLGTIEITLFLGFCFFSKKNKQYSFIIISSVIFFCVSLFLNSHLSIFSMLKTFYPFRILSESERLFPIFYLFFLLPTVFVLERITSKKILFFVFAIFLIERTSFNYYLTEPVSRQKYMGEVAKINTTGGVLDVPLVWDNYQTFRGIEYNVLPFYYGKPIIEGYFNWIAESKKNRTIIDNPIISPLYCRTTVLPPTTFSPTDFRNLLIKHDIRIIVIHKEYISKTACEMSKKTITHYIQNLSAKYSFINIYQDKDASIYVLEFSK